MPSALFRTRVRAGDEGKLTLILVCVQALQGADHLTTLPYVYATYLQAVQVVTHVPVIKNSVREMRVGTESRTQVCEPGG